MQPSQTHLFQRSALCWLKTARILLVLSAAFMAWVCLSPSLQAGIIFQAGSAIVGTGDDFSVPITVSVSPDLASKTWRNAGFDLTWDSSVLILQPTIVGGLPGSPLPLTLGNFSKTSEGGLSFTWTATGPPYPGVSDGSTLFTVNFKAVGAAGSSTSLSGANVAGILFGDFTATTPSFQLGNVTVVPEPINWALGLFACVFIGGATIRQMRSRFLRPAV
jgi:hypothetical protein